MRIGIGNTVPERVSLPGQSGGAPTPPGPPALAQVNNVYSMDFGGTNQSINLGSDFPYPSVSTDPWSISFWIKPNSATSSGYIFSTYDVSGIRGFYVNLRSGGVNNDPLHVSSLMRAGTTGYSSVATSDPIAVGEWQHIVVAFDGVFNATLRGITIYVNGSPVSIYRIGNVTTNGSLITSVNKYIGQREDNSNYLTNCELDEVSVFNVELTAQEVSSIYNATETGKTADLNDLTTPPIKWYRMGD